GLELGFRLGLVRLLQLDVEHLALADRADAAEAEAGEGMLDGLALRVEHAVLEGDGDAGLDHAANAPVRLKVSAACRGGRRRWRRAPGRSAGAVRSRS